MSLRRTCRPYCFTMKISSRGLRLLIYIVKRNTKILNIDSNTTVVLIMTNHTCNLPVVCEERTSNESCQGSDVNNVTIVIVKHLR